MGEVYRARDTKLNRDVALKILPQTFATDPDRLARFHREAQVLASLNHPHIAAIYGFEDSGDTHALVLELVEGPTLADRIARGPIPVDEALAIAAQIAEALEAAHEQGIIHRDLKPANIKVKSDGSVKVLDFGLAKLAEPGSGIGDPGPARAIAALSMSPTITSPAMMTGVGTLLGTAAYMAPEQARGKAVDKRADIWAFGCVLFEMLTGRPAFDGATVTDVVVAVMTRDPDWTALPSATPANIRKLLRRGLDKDAKSRLRDIGDAHAELNDPDAPTAADTDRGGTPPRRYLATFVSLAGVVLAFVFGLRYFSPTQAALPLTKLQIVPPENSTFGTISISPDGRRLAFTAADAAGKERLWVRPLDSVRAQPLPETDGASYPFWSPDSRFVGFFAGSKLRKIEVSGGSPQTICDLENNRGGGRGGTWSREGVILFSVEPYGPEQIYKVSAAGGVPEGLVLHEASAQQNHHHWPGFLPDGRHFLYFAANATQTDRTGIYLASLDTNDARLVIRSETSAAYIVGPQEGARAIDYIFFVREGTLMTQPFDREALALVGDPRAVADDVGADSIGNVSSAHSKFSVSDNGVLVYRGGVRGAQLSWLERSGRPLGLLGSPGLNVDFTISPDGKQVALQREDGRGGADIWLLDAARGTGLRFTSDPKYHASPRWSPDGMRIAFFSIGDGRWQLWGKASTGDGDQESLLKADGDLVTEDWSPDGRFLLYDDIDPRSRKGDLSILRLREPTGKRTVTFVNTPFDENFGSFSPNGKWIVYQSDESGRYEIYIRPVGPDGTATAGKWQVSTNGGVEPRWPRRGHEIFYIGADNNLTAVDVKTGANFEAGVPHALFSTRPSGVVRYDVSADGERFLVRFPPTRSPPPATLVLKWFWKTPPPHVKNKKNLVFSPHPAPKGGGFF